MHPPFSLALGRRRNRAGRSDLVQVEKFLSFLDMMPDDPHVPMHLL